MKRHQEERNEKWGGNENEEIEFFIREKNPIKPLSKMAKETMY